MDKWKAPSWGTGLATLVKQAAEIGKDIEKSIDRSMGVSEDAGEGNDHLEGKLNISGMDDAFVPPREAVSPGLHSMDAGDLMGSFVGGGGDGSDDAGGVVPPTPPPSMGMDADSGGPSGLGGLGWADSVVVVGSGDEPPLHSPTAGSTPAAAASAPSAASATGMADKASELKAGLMGVGGFLGSKFGDAASAGRGLLSGVRLPKTPFAGVGVAPDDQDSAKQLPSPIPAAASPGSSALAPSSAALDADDEFFSSFDTTPKPAAPTNDSGALPSGIKTASLGRKAGGSKRGGRRRPVRVGKGTSAASVSSESAQQSASSSAPDAPAAAPDAPDATAAAPDEPAAAPDEPAATVDAPAAAPDGPAAAVDAPASTSASERPSSPPPDSTDVAIPDSTGVGTMGMSSVQAETQAGQPLSPYAEAAAEAEQSNSAAPSADADSSSSPVTAAVDSPSPANPPAVTADDKEEEGPHTEESKGSPLEQPSMDGWGSDDDLLPTSPELDPARPGSASLVSGGADREDSPSPGPVPVPDAPAEDRSSPTEGVHEASPAPRSPQSIPPPNEDAPGTAIVSGGQRPPSSASKTVADDSDTALPELASVEEIRPTSAPEDPMASNRPLSASSTRSETRTTAGSPTHSPSASPEIMQVTETSPVRDSAPEVEAEHRDASVSSSPAASSPAVPFEAPLDVAAGEEHSVPPLESPELGDQHEQRSHSVDGYDSPVPTTREVSSAPREDLDVVASDEVAAFNVDGMTVAELRRELEQARFREEELEDALAEANTRADQFRDEWQALADKAMTNLDAEEELKKAKELEARLEVVSAELSQRERQIESLSRQAGESLQELNSVTAQLQQSQAQESSLQEELSSMRASLKEAEKQIRQLKSRSSDTASLQAEIDERDARIDAILQEAEGLSKRQAAQETTIRTLRQTTRKAEETAKAAVDAKVAAEAKAEELRQQVAELEKEAHGAHQAKESISGDAAAKAKKVRALEDKVAQLTDEVYSVKAALSAAQAEADAQKTIVKEALQEAEEAERAQERAESTVAAAKDAEAAAIRQQNVLESELKELRGKLLTAEQSSGSREDELQEELTSLRERFQVMEARCEDLEHGASVSAATQPLLEQIAVLQSQADSRRREWNSTRVSLQARVAEAESAAKAADSERKSLESLLADATHESSSLRTELVTLRTAKARAEAALQLSTSKVSEFERRIAELTAQETETRSSLEKAQHEVSELRQKCAEECGRREQAEQVATLLRQQLQDVTSEAETAAATITKLKAKLREDRSGGGLRGADLNPPDSKTSAALLGAASGLGLSAPLGSGDPDAVATGSAGDSSTGTMDGPDKLGTVSVARLRALVRARAGEVKSLQETVRALDSEKAGLTNELVSLTTKNAQLEASVGDLGRLKEQLADVTARHDVLLELLGEKEEELEEMRTEFEDVKETYRIQLEELMRRVTEAEAH